MGKRPKRPRLYVCWADMKSRCNNPNEKSYKYYGGRGIKVCDEWNDYEPFAKWAYENGYDESLTYMECSLDRIDNDKGYSPDNCRWVSFEKQCNNRRSNVVIEHNGERKTASEWAREYGIHPETVQIRARKGVTGDELFTKKNRHHVILRYNGEEHTIAEWSRKLGISKGTIRNRVIRNYPIEDIFFVGRFPKVKRGR